MNKVDICKIEHSNINIFHGRDNITQNQSKNVPDIDHVFPEPVCPYAKIVPLKPSKARSKKERKLCVNKIFNKMSVLL